MTPSRGDVDATLVRLWNELEPARLSGDSRRLRGIERAATRIVREGDEAQQREATRLLEELRELAREEGTVPATDRLDAEVAMGGRVFRDAPPAEFGEDEAQEATFDEADHETDDGEEAAESRGLRRLAPLVWIVVFVVILLVNLLGNRE
jgi:hypothetical protein